MIKTFPRVPSLCLFEDGTSRTLVEGIFCEIHHRVIDTGGDAGVDSSGDASGNILLRVPVHEIAALLFHDLLLLFTHCAAHQIASAEGVTAQIPYNLQ